MFANTKMHAFTYNKQHQDYLHVTDKATFFQPLLSPVFCVKNHLAHDI
jgi:hypothetical protein